MKKLPYGEGDVFCVPLADGTFSLGVIARMTNAGKVLLGYFFTTVFRQCPNVETMPLLRAEDAARIIRFGDLGLFNGEWTVVGRLPEWQRADWPMPPFIMRPPLTNTASLIFYSDEDPNKVSRIVKCDPNIDAYAKDSVFGYGAVAALIRQIVSEQERISETDCEHS
jgi:hypothetical protein